MKHQNQKITASTTATFSSGLLRRNNWLATTVAAAAISLAVADHAAAAPISKADTADNLTVPTSWVGGVVPTSADVAVWDSTVATAANASTPALGADTNWAGILISNPSGPVAIPAGNTLSLGASGVDMSAASQGLNLACGLTLTANQTFNITSGMNLTNTGVIGGGFSITRAGAGTWTLPTAGSTYTGGTILASGTNQIASIGNGHFGTGSITLTNGAVLALFSASTGDPGGGGGAFTNALIVPAGMTGTLWNHWRGAFSGPLTGSGTLNMRANGVRGDITGNWTNFAGSINLTSRTGNDDLRIALGGTVNYTFQNTKLNMAAGVNLYQSVNPPSGAPSETAQFIGELSGSAGAFLLGNPVGGRFANWTIGGLNTDSTFAGVIGSSAGSSRVTKIGTGTLTLIGNNVYFGSTVVSGGRVVMVTGGSSVNSVSTLVRTNTALGVFVSPNASQWTGTNIIFGQGATNEFNFAGSVPSTTTAPLLVMGNLTYSNLISVKVMGGNWAVGTYPLVKFNSMTNGSGFAGLTLFSQPARVLGYLSNDTVNAQISYVVTNATQPLSWATNNQTWDTVSANWLNAAGAAATYSESGGLGDSVQFEDSVSVGTPITVTLNSAVVPTGVKVNATKNYTISGNGSIGGVASLTKTGSGTLTLGTTNNFTGGANLNGGITTFSTLANLGNSNSPVSFGGGTLKYNGNSDDISSRTVTFNAGGATIDTAGSTVSYARPVGNSGAGGLTKLGAGTLTLNGTNRYTGATIVGAGTLALGSATTVITNSSSITVSNGATLDATTPGLTLGGVVGQTLRGAGAVSGSVTTIASTTISPGFSAGTMTFNNNLTVNGGTLLMEVSTNTGASDLIIVSGTLTLTAGTIQISALNTLTNGTYKLISQSALSGAVANLTLSGFSQPNKLATLSSAIAGEIDLIIKGQASDNEVWGGYDNNFWDEETTANWTTNAGVTHSIFIDGDLVTFNDYGAAQPSVAIYAAVLPSSVTVSNVAVNPYTFTDGAGGGAGKISGSTGLVKAGSGTLIVNTINNNSGATQIKAGTVQVGDGTSNGDIGSGNITNNGAVVFQQTDNRSVVGSVSGSGSLAQNGATTLTLSASNSYTGQTAINSGSTLQVGNGGANGTLGFGTITNAGTLLINRTGTITVTNGISGSQSGGGVAQLIKIGSSTLTLGGSNTYEGNTYISNGVVKLAASEVIPNGGTTTGWLILDGNIGTAGTLDLNGFNETVNTLSGSTGASVGQIVNNVVGITNSLTVGCSNVTTYAGLIRNNTGTGGVVQLIKNGANAFTLNNGGSTYSGGTLVNEGQLNFQFAGAVGSGEVVLNNGATLNLSQGGTPSQFPGNNVRTLPNSIATISSANLANAWGGLFSCADATSTNIFPLTGAGSSIGGSDVFSFGSFPGTIQLDASGTIRFLGAFQNPPSYNGGPNTRFVINGGLGSRNGQNLYLGELSGSGSLNGTGAPGANPQLTIYNIGSKGTDSQYDGTINGTLLSTTALVKSGAGRLTLTGAMNYDGSTTVSNGVLAIVEPTSFDASPTINLNASTATIDVSARADTALNLGTQTLNGIGKINGNLAASVSSTVNVGLGTLNVTNVATVSGVLTMQLNRTNAPNCSKLTAATLTITAALTVTNVGPALLAGDTFLLFAGATTGFSVTNLPTLVAPLYWTNKLAVNGSIAVASSVNVNPTNVTAVVNGSNLELSWPADHIGWSLQAQTNSLATGLSTNWVTIPNTGLDNHYTNTFNAANGTVFYRMVYP